MWEEAQRGCTDTGCCAWTEMGLAFPPFSTLVTVSYIEPFNFDQDETTYTCDKGRLEVCNGDYGRLSAPSLQITDDSRAK